MDREAVLRLWREACAEGLDLVRDGADRWQVHVPAFLPDGHGVEIDAVRTPDGWQLTDNGQVTSELQLGGYNWTTPSRLAAITDVARAYGAKFEQRELTTATDDPPTLTDVMRFVQALSAVGGLEFYDAVATASGPRFKKIVGGFLESRVRPGVGVIRDYQSSLDSKQLYVADYGLAIGNHQRPLAVVFTPASTEPAERAAGQARWWLELDVDFSRPSMLSADPIPRVAVVPADRADGDPFQRLLDAVSHPVLLDEDDTEGEALQPVLTRLGAAA